jgi:aspartate aminotransferase
MTISSKIDMILKKSSWIRKMFEEGGKLKAKYGAENVYDFSLGNPNLNPPDAFEKTILEILKEKKAGIHKYMENAGHSFARKAVAEQVSKEQGKKLTENDIIMTCGASGGLNIIFKTILEPGDEVITPAPYFVEYNFYTDNHGGVLKTADTNEDFTLNINNIELAITEKTKAVLINSPHNPTGQIYSEEDLKKLSALLKEKSKEYGKTIYLISDEPYRKIVFNKAKVAGIFGCYKNSIVTTSYSKDMSIPGERLGFVAVNPEAEFKNDLMAGMTLANRILGFVNAPSLAQIAMSRLQGISVDISEYERKKNLFCKGLKECGYEFIEPKGAFYIFPKSPIKDDVLFVQKLQEERVLVVPGSGFGRAGHFRIAFCVEDKTITGSMQAFDKVMKAFV